MFKSFIYLFLFFLLSLSGPSQAAKSKKTLRVPGKKWVFSLKKKAIKNWCNKKSHFVQCYKVGKRNCLMSMNQYFNRCQKKAKIPRRLLPATEGVPLVAGIGVCVGKAYHDKFSRQFQKKKGCI